MRCPGWPCDTPYAIEPSLYLHDSVKLDPEKLAVNIIKECEETGAPNVCLTGGEPFLQPNTGLESLVKQLHGWGLNIECFSNGSFIYPDWALEMIDFVMDWKLEGSGEADTNRTERYANAYKLGANSSIKFVVKNETDLQEARKVTDELKLSGVKAQLWVGTAWAQNVSDQRLVEFIQEYKMPWRLNVQVHKYIWSPVERGV